MISLSYTVTVLILHVHCVVASMSMLTIPIADGVYP